MVAMGRSVSGCAMKLYTKTVSQVVAKGPRARARLPLGNNVLGDSFQHGPGLENECRQHDPTQVGAWSQLRYDVREDWPVCQCSHVWQTPRGSLPFPWSGSTTSSSPLPLESSTDDLPGSVSDSGIFDFRGLAVVVREETHWPRKRGGDAGPAWLRSETRKSKMFLGKLWNYVRRSSGIYGGGREAGR